MPQPPVGIDAHESSHRQLTRNQRSYPPTPVSGGGPFRSWLRRSPCCWQCSWPASSGEHRGRQGRGDTRRCRSKRIDAMPRSSRAAPSRSARESSSRTFLTTFPCFRRRTTSTSSPSEPTQSLLSWVIGGDEPVMHWLTEFEKYRQPDAEPASGAVAADDGNVRRRGQVRRPQGGWIRPEDRAAGPRGGFAGVPRGPGRRQVPAACALAKLLVPSDVIVKANGKDVMSTTDLSTALRTRSRATPSASPCGAVRRMSPATSARRRSRRPEPGDRRLRPVRPFDIELPFDVDIDTGSIGGPSAGAAFTVTLLDELTKGDLLHGDVAMTGTIALDGTIGAIGGLPQKAEAVRQTGVDLFLVPAQVERGNRRADRRGRSRHRSGGRQPS